MTKFRKIGLVLLSALFALCAMIAIFSLNEPATASAAGTAVTKGDVDNDGDIDLDDIILVRQYLAGLVDFTENQKQAADVAGKDNQITLDDAIRMEQYVAGMNVTFEYACEHTYDAGVVTAPTCTEQGYTTYTCTNCGYSYQDNYTDALGHSYDAGVVTKDATCTEDGVKTYTCGTCGDTYTEVIPANGHNYEAVVTAPTCTEQGYTTYTCLVCQDSYVADYTDALGHSYDAVMTAPTCTEQGYTTYTCSVCNYSYKDNYIDATGHTYVNGVCEDCGDICLSITSVARTAVNNNVETYTIYLSDGSTYTFTVTNGTDGTDGASAYDIAVANGFTGTESEWLASLVGVGIENIATNSKGEVVIYLTDGTYYALDVSASDYCTHEFIKETISPTCTSQGYDIYTCSKCGYSYINNYVEPSGHHYYERYCAICGEEEPYGEIVYDTSWYTGNTSASSYTLTTKEQLAGLAYLVNIDGVTFSGKTIYLGNDIDLASYEWTPIGTSSMAFAGTFNGQNFTIYNLYISDTYEYAGLFGNTSGTLKDFKISGASIYTAERGQYIAIASGYSTSKAISGITVSGYIDAANATYVGGIVGYLTMGSNSATYSDLTNNATISGTSYVGGVFGIVYASVGNYSNYTIKLTSINNTGAITGSSDYVGGIAGNWYTDNTSGYNYTVTATEFTNSGTVAGASYVGGLLGYFYCDNSSTLTYSENTGTITGSDYCAALVGSYSNLTIS